MNDAEKWAQIVGILTVFGSLIAAAIVFGAGYLAGLAKAERIALSIHLRSETETDRD